MKVVKEGHVYEVQNHEDKTKSQTIMFVEKGNPDSNGKLALIADGTTNEELLEVLIDRISFLNRKNECAQNFIVLRKLKKSLEYLRHRTEIRIARGIEGTNKTTKDVPNTPKEVKPEEEKKA